MGRPRIHDAATGIALLEAAERIVEADGLEALSIRRVADEVGTSSRAVYSVFGSKRGLVVALGARAFDLLGSTVAALPVTDDPAADLVASGVVGFRTFALQHSALFRIGVQRVTLSPDVAREFVGAATSALGSLNARLSRLADDGGLGSRSVSDAAWEFHALCEGLAALELRHNVPVRRARHLWTDALSALVAGWPAVG